MFSYIYMLLNSEEGSVVLSPSPYVSANMTDLLNLVASFDMIGGAIWVVWGTIVLAGSLKDKNGPGLQSGTWQIIGGLMIMVATLLFKNMTANTKLLNEVLELASKFSMVGGALWTIWGVIILAGALRDKTGPTLQSAIWQIVGGLLIIIASEMFTFVAHQS